MRQRSGALIFGEAIRSNLRRGIGRATNLVDKSDSTIAGCRYPSYLPLRGGNMFFRRIDAPSDGTMHETPEDCQADFKLPLCQTCGCSEFVIPCVRMFVSTTRQLDLSL